MSDLNKHLEKIETSIDQLITSINTLQKVAEEDSGNTAAKFKITVANTAKCRSLINILKRKILYFLSANLKSKLNKVNKNTHEIRKASNNMDCRAIAKTRDHRCFPGHEEED